MAANESQAKRIPSPCVGLCSTTVGDRVCRGCQRTDDEIRDWFALDPEARTARMQALDALRVRVASRFLHVDDPASLEAQLVRHRIRFRREQPSLSRAVELLRVGRTRMQDLSRYGLRRHASVARLAPDALYAALQEALLQEALCRLTTAPTEPPV
ncbi:hypothetical protein C8E00_103242 [Chromohalobacter marismortui]|uniref:Uncharacterized protein n=1 Tax=Chromohalobacter marismortui TaxID=42055 RepID=A0A4V3F4A9_9GAMM|nr:MULTISPECIES: DUF1289 domain-containing protein [Chromohalobacter]MCI0508758.1 DUF1289 domain-containing protein [Chromohalobacter sp.]MCI0594597.1 DUF1289 domain-containing protein [Chromohalobacter sp.]TDU22876.1 hypothetical protein C8E00_103242 [Chromohalobacter marismortui]